MKSVPWTSRPLPRYVLLLVAGGLVAHCAVLALQYRAVPPGECFRAGLAMLFAQLFSLRFRAKRVDLPVRPLASSSVFRLITVRLIILTSALISLVLPWAIILVLDNDNRAVLVLGPQLFAFATQLLFEIWSFRAEIAVSLRVIIPVAFVSYRLSLIADWISLAPKLPNPDVARACLVLGVVNAAFWSFVLFYVLLFKVCPPYFAEKSKGEDVKREEQARRAAEKSAPPCK